MLSGRHRKAILMASANRAELAALLDDLDRRMPGRSSAERVRDCGLWQSRLLPTFFDRS
jgi:hypothetical protein